MRSRKIDPENLRIAVKMQRRLTLVLMVAEFDSGALTPQVRRKVIDQIACESRNRYPCRRLKGDAKSIEVNVAGSGIDGQSGKITHRLLHQLELIARVPTYSMISVGAT